MTKMATDVFGSGWVWLCSDFEGNLELISAPDEYNPIIDQDCNPIMGIDVWEHAYYLYYLNDRASYLKFYWPLVDWELIESFYEDFALKGKAVPT